MNYELLINKTNTILEDSFKDITLVETVDIHDNKILVEEATFAHFQELKEKEKETAELGILGAYRSAEQQMAIYERKKELYGIDYANKIVAPVGASEHQSGLALDISVLVNGKFPGNNKDLMENEKEFAGIHKVLHKYGFILRYPKGKESITGYPYEPWHIRYVGVELATKLYNENLTLDEYYNL